MWQKNDGQSEVDKLQNRFTSYISIAIQRRRNAYIFHNMRQQQTEILTENPLSDGENDIVDDILEELPLLMRLENDTLLNALKELNERERQVFLARVLDDKSFKELTHTFGLGYKGVAAVYYRALNKIRKKMKEAGDEF